MQNKQSNTMKKKDKDSNQRVRAIVVAPKDTLDEQEDENDLRQRIRENIKKRRSSVMESFREFLSPEGNVRKRVDQIIHVPKTLQVLVGKADVMTQREMTEEIMQLQKTELLDNFLNPSGSLCEDDIIPAVVCAMYMQVKEKKREEKAKTKITSVLVAALFEIADEVSDIVMSIMFSINAENLGWAATLMFVFMGINRLVNSVLMDEDVSSFLFSTVNWKQTLRDELWDIPIHASGDWGIEELFGDTDANHGMHVRNYKSCDLPWDKIKAWLITKKASFLESPPIWMTVDWFDNLTPEVKKSVWKEAGELELLIEKVAEVTQAVNEDTT
eukprot:g4105.t1